MAARVAIVVLYWNKLAQTLSCIAAVDSLTYRNTQLIIVDNGSILDIRPALTQYRHTYTLIKNERNLGFTGGVNQGIRQAMQNGADYIWLLNNDAEPDRDALEKMIDAATLDPRVGMLSPQLANADTKDEIEFCGGLWDPKTLAFCTTNEISTYRRWVALWPNRIVLYGTALLIKRRVVETIGLLDDNFFAYFEDIDYSIRSNLSGFRNIIVTDAIVRHKFGDIKRNPEDRPPYYYYYKARNEILCLRKHAGILKGRKALLWAINRDLDDLQRLQSHPDLRDAIYAGILDGIRNRGEQGPSVAQPRGLRVLSILESAIRWALKIL